MFVISVISFAGAFHLFAKSFFEEDIQQKDVIKTAAAFLLLLLIGFTSLLNNIDREQILKYNQGIKELDVTAQRVELVREQSNSILDNLPDKTLELYEKVGADGLIKTYPDVEFISLLKEQLESERELIRIYALKQSEIEVRKEALRNRRLFAPSRWLVPKEYESKLLKIENKVF